MSDKALTSIELAKELGVKSTEIVRFVEKLRNTEFKKGTTKIKIELEEAEKIREHFSKKEETPKIHEEAPIKEEIPPSQTIEKPIAPEEKITEEDKPEKIEIPKIPEKKETVEEEIKGEIDEELDLPGRFRREISFEKIEKIKPKPIPTKIPPKKIEPKKWLDLKEQKKQKDKNKRKNQ